MISFQNNKHGRPIRAARVYYSVSKILTISVGPSSRRESIRLFSPVTVTVRVPPRLWAVSTPPGSRPWAQRVEATEPQPVPQARV